ncbi:MAG: hypothetical protein ABJE95_18385 [Byssovorax sp.]
MRVARAALAVLAAGLALVGCGGESVPVDGIAGPSTWTALYTDYFASGAAGSCAAGDCHGAADQSGVTVSKFVCADQAGCYASMTGDSHLVIESIDKANPGKSRLLTALRQATNKGRMPSSSTFVFRAVDVTRIETWISDGAKND